MKKIITVGGGTGSFTVLSGLKNFPDIDLTALVSMADDGGSTGALRDELGVLPAGDVRQCLVALSEHTDIVRNLINYRFTDGSLKGHSFGNIFLAALEKVTGNFREGVEIASEILKVNGRVVPITGNKAELCISLNSGKSVCGENKIQDAPLQKDGIKEIFYKESVELNPHAKDEILRADYIILGPGNYYCSIIPNLIVQGFREALLETKAKLIFPVNLTNKLGHTTDWSASEYVRDIEKYFGRPVDIIILNNEPPSPLQIKRYKMEEGEGVLVKDDLDDQNDRRVVRGKLLSHIIYEKPEEDILPGERGFIRHDSAKLANILKDIIGN